MVGDLADLNAVPVVAVHVEDRFFNRWGEGQCFLIDHVAEHGVDQKGYGVVLRVGSAELLHQAGECPLQSAGRLEQVVPVSGHHLIPGCGFVSLKEHLPFVDPV